MGYSPYETSTQGIMVAVLIMCSSCAWHIQDMSYNYHDSLHMSWGEMGYCIIKFTHKVDFTFSPKCWGSNCSGMFDISRWFAMILKFLIHWVQAIVKWHVLGDKEYLHLLQQQACDFLQLNMLSCPFCWLNLSTSGDSMPNLRTFQALLVECVGHKHFYMVLKWDETWLGTVRCTCTWRSKALFAVSAWRKKSWVGELWWCR